VELSSPASSLAFAYANWTGMTAQELNGSLTSENLLNYLSYKYNAILNISENETTLTLPVLHYIDNLTLTRWTERVAGLSNLVVDGITTGILLGENSSGALIIVNNSHSGSMSLTEGSHAFMLTYYIFTGGGPGGGGGKPPPEEEKTCDPITGENCPPGGGGPPGGTVIIEHGGNQSKDFVVSPREITGSPFDPSLPNMTLRMPTVILINIGNSTIDDIQANFTCDAGTGVNCAEKWCFFPQGFNSTLNVGSTSDVKIYCQIPGDAELGKTYSTVLVFTSGEIQRTVRITIRVQKGLLQGLADLKKTFFSGPMDFCILGFGTEEKCLANFPNKLRFFDSFIEKFALGHLLIIILLILLIFVPDSYVRAGSIVGLGILAMWALGWI
jgi:hypothetical protein